MTPAARLPAPEPRDTRWTLPDGSEIRKLIAESGRTVEEARKNVRRFAEVRREFEILLDKWGWNCWRTTQLRQHIDEIVRRSHTGAIAAKYDTQTARRDIRIAASRFPASDSHQFAK